MLPPPPTPGAVGSVPETRETQQQAHYLLVLAHVMKCTNPMCTVQECAPTKVSHLRPPAPSSASTGLPCVPCDVSARRRR
eukprot:3697348-Pleurochrysis_carterae.AAC.3